MNAYTVSTVQNMQHKDSTVRNNQHTGSSEYLLMYSKSWAGKTVLQHPNLSQSLFYYTSTEVSGTFCDGLTNSNNNSNMDNDNISYNEIFPCPICKRRFATKHKLEHHLFVHTNNYYQESRIDNVQQGALEHQSKQVDTQPEFELIKQRYTQYECKQCVQKFSLSTELKRREEVHIDENPSFTTESHLNSLKTIHGSENPNKCQECGEDFKKLSDLCSNIFVPKHKIEKDLKRQSANVAITTGKKEDIDSDRHRYVDKQICEFCGEAFTHQDQYNKHKLIHHEKPYKCHVCGKGFTQSSNLTKHGRVHTGKKPYKCEECGKGFTCSSNLTVHKRVHIGKKPYKCEECGKSFTSSSHLTVHKRIHSGEKPYKCEECGKGFNQSSYLKTHKRVHSSEKPYKCEDCGKVFTQSLHLRKHKKIHSSEKPYKCEECCKGFISSSDLTRHSRVHSSEKPYKCEECGKAFSQNKSLKGHYKVHSAKKNGMMLKNSSENPHINLAQVLIIEMCSADSFIIT